MSCSCLTSPVSVTQLLLASENRESCEATGQCSHCIRACWPECNGSRLSCPETALISSIAHSIDVKLEVIHDVWHAEDVPVRQSRPLLPEHAKIQGPDCQDGCIITCSEVITLCGCAADSGALHEQVMQMHAEMVAALQQHQQASRAILADLDEVAGLKPLQVSVTHFHAHVQGHIVMPACKAGMLGCSLQRTLLIVMSLRLCWQSWHHTQPLECVFLHLLLRKHVMQPCQTLVASTGAGEGGRGGGREGAGGPALWTRAQARALNRHRYRQRELLSTCTCLSLASHVLCLCSTHCVCTAAQQLLWHEHTLTMRIPSP